MSSLKDIVSNTKAGFSRFVIGNLINTESGRKYVLDLVRKKGMEYVEHRSPHELKAVRNKKYQWIYAVASQILKSYGKGYISPHVAKKALEVIGTNNFLKHGLPEFKKARESFYNKYGTYPPLFVLVSPTQRCNLKCVGCYASSSSETAATIPFDVVDRIFKENHDIFGSRFIVISGGEPMMYKSEGKTLLDLFEKYNDTFFIFYTNGTLITKEVAERLAKSGNAIPQISVEGFEKETDERRGKGVFQKILKAMENLREAGMPFVVSVTSTKKNVNTLLSDEFYDFWFEKQGAIHMWQFQLMPIGRGKEVFDLMPSPEERIKLYRKWEESLSKGYPVADFWNSGVLSNGCIAYGRRDGGYFYIDWNGNIMPCAFVPYYQDNIYDLYNQGKTLADALFSDFFKRGREWQKKYGFADFRNPENWLMPCSIKDHYKNFREAILSKDVKSEDALAEEARNSDEYFQKLIEYDEELRKLTQPIWEKEYKEKG